MSAHCGIKREQRRQALIALVADNGGDQADFHKLARIAVAMALYGPKTNLCDIKVTLERAWRFRKRIH